MAVGISKIVQNVVKLRKITKKVSEILPHPRFVTLGSAESDNSKI